MSKKKKVIISISIIVIVIILIYHLPSLFVKYESKFAFGPYQALGNNDELWLFFDFPRMVKRPGISSDYPRVIPIGRFQEVVILNDNGLKKRTRVSINNGITFHPNISHIFVHKDDILLHQGESMSSLDSIFEWNKDHFELLPFETLEGLVPGFKNMRSYEIDQQLELFTSRYGWEYVYDTRFTESFIEWKKWRITVDAIYKDDEIEVEISMVSPMKENDPIVLSYEKHYEMFNRAKYKKLISEKRQTGHKKGGY